MTQTIQLRSCAYLNKARININKPEVEENLYLLLSIFDSLNTLCEKLSRLNYVIQRKNIEQIVYGKVKRKSLTRCVNIKLTSPDSDHS